MRDILKILAVVFIASVGIAAVIVGLWLALGNWAAPFFSGLFALVLVRLIVGGDWAAACWRRGLGRMAFEDPPRSKP